MGVYIPRKLLQPNGYPERDLNPHFARKRDFKPMTDDPRNPPRPAPPSGADGPPTPPSPAISRDRPRICPRTAFAILTLSLAAYPGGRA